MLTIMDVLHLIMHQHPGDGIQKSVEYDRLDHTLFGIASYSLDYSDVNTNIA